jgi:hypothetical protein
MEFVVAIVSGITAFVVALIERRTRREDERWEVNSKEHEALVARMDSIGSGLGRSLDRVEENLTTQIGRLENKVDRHDEVLFDHLASHAETATHAHATTDVTKLARKKMKER